MAVIFEELAHNIVTRVDPKTTDHKIYVGLEHLDTDSLQIKRKGTPTDVKGEKLLVKNGDIIFGKRRVYQRKVGIADFNGICSAHSMVLRPKEDTILKELFPFFLQSDQFMKRALQISVGSLSPTINWKTLAKQEFTIPAKSDQSSIATLLWAAEDCIVKNERFVEEAERAKQVLMRELFSKGIGHLEFHNTEVGMIPKSWQIKKLQSLVKDHNSGVYKKKELYGEGCNIVGVADLYKIHHIGGQEFRRVPLSEEEKIKFTLKNNDLLYNESSLVKEGIARTLYVTEKGAGTAFAWHTRRYSIDQDKVLSIFLYYYLEGPGRKHMLRKCIQTAITGINTTDYFACPILIPPPSEQRQIAAILDQCDGMIAIAHENLISIKALKMKLINQIFSEGIPNGI